MSYSEQMFLEDEPLSWPAPVVGEASCALPDLGRVLVLALAAVVIASAAGLWVINKIRPW